VNFGEEVGVELKRKNGIIRKNEKSKWF